MKHTFHLRKTIIATASMVAMAFGVGSATASTVQVTIDLTLGSSLGVPSPYLEDGFEISGNSLLLSSSGNPPRSVLLDN